jgi:hypothetical protein
MYERRLVGALALRVIIERNAALMRPLEPESAAVLGSFARVIEAIETNRPDREQYMEIGAVIDRIRDFERYRKQPPAGEDRPVLALVRDRDL